MEIFSTALFWLILVSVLLTMGVLWSIKDPGIPKILVILAGVLLILIAAVFLGMFEGLASILATKYNETGEVYLNYKVAALIVPFYSAAIGTNLITHAVTQHEAYAKAPSTKFVFKESALMLLKISTYPLSLLFKSWAENKIRDHEQYKKYLSELSQKKPWN
ncbi:MAG TPA: hypothetical protein VIQ81_08565 [Gammaproteobacteria bacterium]